MLSQKQQSSTARKRQSSVLLCSAVRWAAWANSAWVVQHSISPFRNATSADTRDSSTAPHCSSNMRLVNAAAATAAQSRQLQCVPAESGSRQQHRTCRQLSLLCSRDSLSCSRSSRLSPCGFMAALHGRKVLAVQLGGIAAWRLGLLTCLCCHATREEHAHFELCSWSCLELASAHGGRYD